MTTITAITATAKSAYCSACPAAMLCATGMVCLNTCYFCNSPVCISKGAMPFRFTSSYSGRDYQRIVTLEKWEQWKKERVKGIGIEEVPSPPWCRVLSINNGNTNNYTSNGDRLVMVLRWDVCDKCFSRIEGVMYNIKIVDGGVGGVGGVVVVAGTPAVMVSNIAGTPAVMVSNIAVLNKRGTEISVSPWRV